MTLFSGGRKLIGTPTGLTLRRDSATQGLEEEEEEEVETSADPTAVEAQKGSEGKKYFIPRPDFRNVKNIFFAWRKILKKPEDLPVPKEEAADAAPPSPPPPPPSPPPQPPSSPSTEKEGGSPKKPRVPQAFLKSIEDATEALRNKVSETARAWSASSGVPSLIGGNQHQRLEGGSGEDLLSSTSSPHASYQSSPTLMERGREKGANLFGNEAGGGYQRLNNPRKNSWDDGWGPEWEKKEEAASKSAEPQRKLSSSKKSSKTSVAKESKADGGNLLLDLSSASSALSDSKGKTTTVHTWDNWDNDEWEKND